jgi:hypothetical protein
MEKILTEEKFYVEHEMFTVHGVYTRFTTENKAIWTDSRNVVVYELRKMALLEKLFQEQLGL